MKHNQIIESLPANLKEKALETLKAYNQVYATYYEDGTIEISTGVAITAHNQQVEQVYTITANEVYTEEQQKINFFEVFGYNQR